MADFRIWSDEFAANGHLTKNHEFDQQAFGVDGKNVSPALQWDGVPPEAKSLALTVYDPDAPTGSGFWHWIVVNIPVDTRSLPQNAGVAADGSLLPAGALQMRQRLRHRRLRRRCTAARRQTAPVYFPDPCAKGRLTCRSMPPRPMQSRVS